MGTSVLRGKKKVVNKKKKCGNAQGDWEEHFHKARRFVMHEYISAPL